MLPEKINQRGFMKLIGRVKTDIKTTIKDYDFLDGYVIDCDKVKDSIINKLGENTLGVVVNSVEDCKNVKEKFYDYLVIENINIDILTYVDTNFQCEKHVHATTRQERQIIVTRPGASSYVMYDKIKESQENKINLSGIMCDSDNPIYGQIALARGLDFIQYDIGDGGISVDRFKIICDWRDHIKEVMKNIV